ncbi:MAG: bifunctional diaminohydroxyphosphoribosylaminopyrimidine deaminase/5-amino-6-(5-phosphoribosylamino)uracil reductase RibD [Maritimibacter sp.]
MTHALSLARRGLGAVWPNPAVGCVVIKDGRVVGRGWTQPGGRPHAETMALAQAGQAAEGATVYVTLEPCSHHGKTPPCAEALIEARVARVVVALGDPDPRVNGQGIARLRSAKIQVDEGICAAEARADHIGFLSSVTKGRPFVTLKLASSLDGRIATASGESKWITGSGARRLVHAQRMRHDAVLVGAGTVRADDPSLNVRGMGAAHQPTRIVMSRHLDLPLSSQLASTAMDSPVWILHGEGANPDLVSAWERLGATLISVPVVAGQLDATSALQALGKAGLTRVFVEGGAALAASLVSADVVDEFIGFTAGIIIGAEGRPALAAMGLDHLASAPRYELVETAQIGADILHRWRRTDRQS